MKSALLAFTYWDNEYLTFMKVEVVTIEFSVEAVYLKNRVIVSNVSSYSVFKLFRPAYCPVGVL